MNYKISLFLLIGSCVSAQYAEQVPAKPAVVANIPQEVRHFEMVSTYYFQKIFNEFLTRITKPYAATGVPFALAADSEFRQYLQLVVAQCELSIKDHNYERCLIYADQAWFNKYLGHRLSYDPCAILQTLLAESVGNYLANGFQLMPALQQQNTVDGATALSNGEYVYRIVCTVATYETKRFAERLLALWEPIQKAMKAKQTATNNALAQQAAAEEQ